MTPVRQLESQPKQPLRIVAIGESWYGSNSNSYVSALRREGHSVTHVTEDRFATPGWRNPALRVLRRVADGLIVADFNAAAKREIDFIRPDLLFVFKGFMVEPETVRLAQNSGGVAINFWPDVSVMAHGPRIPKTLPTYDWVFTTKTFGVNDMRLGLGIQNSSFIPHGFDPEVHKPAVLAISDSKRLGCDASFIGTWSPKKEALLGHLVRSLPEIKLRIWGGLWGPHGQQFHSALEDREVFGSEYAKAICASKINIAILSEARTGASSGDLSTTRTFEIPAAGGFMLHERTAEADALFKEGRECAMFGDADELVAKVRYYLDHPEERVRIAAAGHERCMTSGYSYDDRVAVIIEKAREIAAARAVSQSLPRN